MTFDLESQKIKKTHLVITYLSPLYTGKLTRSESPI